MHSQFKSKATQIVATVYFETLWVMRSENKTGCETTSSELGTGSAHQWKERGRELEMEHSRLRVWKPAPSNSRKKPGMFADGGPSLFQGSRRKWNCEVCIWQVAS